MHINAPSRESAAAVDAAGRPRGADFDQVQLGTSPGNSAEIPDWGCPATEVTSAHTELSAIDEDVAQRDRSCLVDAAVEPDGP